LTKRGTLGKPRDVTIPKPPGDANAPANEANERGPMINPLAGGIPPIRSNLVLTPSQESEMVDRAIRRIDELSAHAGLWLLYAGTVDPTRWMGRRMRNQWQYDNDWLWRVALGGIFNYCVAPETLVLTTNLIWKRADELAVGEELIGFDEEGINPGKISKRRHWKSGLVHDTPTGGYQRKFRKTSVLNADRLARPCLEITTDDGTIRCSTKHRLLVQKGSHWGFGKYQWLPADEISEGDSLVWIVAPWTEDTSKLAGYIAGVFDGEGWVGKGLAFAQKKNEVFAATIDGLAKKGFECKTFADYEQDSCVVTHIMGGLGEKLRFLGTFRPHRLLNKSSALWEGRDCCSKGSRRSKITAIESCGVQEVIALKTGTGTFIANGFLSHNSNFSLNISKRYARLMSAKSRDDLIGTDPFFAIMPEDADPQDIQTAEAAEKYLQLKARQSNVKESLAEGLKTALIQGEAVMKITYVADATKFRGPAEVAIGPFVYVGAEGQVLTPPGEPVMTPRGNYIYRNDEWVPDPAVQNQFRLKKEPMVATRYTPQFKFFPALDQVLTQQQGVDLRVVDFRDFLCPLNAASIHEADINVHMFDMPWERLIQIYGMFEVSQPYVNQPYMSGEKAAKMSKDEVQGEAEAGSLVLKTVNCADVYMRMDVDDDNFEEDIWLVIDRKAKKAIWYDYMGAHLKKRPFEVIPGVEKVQNRWYGTGVFEMLDHKQLYVDTAFNRINFKASKNSSVRFRVRNAVAEWKAGQELVFGDDQVLTIEDPRFNAQNPPLFAVDLPDTDPFSMKLIELALQAAQTEVGISGPNDAQMAGLDTGKLATGIEQMEREANVLMKETVGVQGKAVAAVLDQVVDCVLEHMDESEVLYDEDTQSLIHLNREAIRNIGKHTRLLLTRSRSTETIETARMVIQLCREYYEALNPQEQNLLRPEYVRQARALEVQDADRLFRKVTDEEVAQWKQAQQNAGDLPPKTSIATKYTDLERSEQEQVLQREKIQPAQIGPLTSHQQQEVTQTGAEAKAKEVAKAAFAPNPAEKLEMDRQEHAQKMRQSEEKHQAGMRQTIEKTAVTNATRSTNGEQKGKK
jgi:hypothetical protein